MPVQEIAEEDLGPNAHVPKLVAPHRTALLRVIRSQDSEAGDSVAKDLQNLYVDILRAGLRKRCCLVVIDNLEHVDSLSAKVLQRLIASELSQHPSGALVSPALPGGSLGFAQALPEEHPVVVIGSLDCSMQKDVSAAVSPWAGVGSDRVEATEGSLSGTRRLSLQPLSDAAIGSIACTSLGCTHLAEELAQLVSGDPSHHTLMLFGSVPGVHCQLVRWLHDVAHYVLLVVSCPSLVVATWAGPYIPSLSHLVLICVTSVPFACLMTLFLPPAVRQRSCCPAPSYCCIFLSPAPHPSSAAPAPDRYCLHLCRACEGQPNIGAGGVSLAPRPGPRPAYGRGGTGYPG